MMDNREQNLQQPAEIMVTVVVVTYNHSAFIARALDSIEAQEIDFPLQIVVADDGSTDDTVAILQQYAARRPERYILLLGSRQEGVVSNAGRTLAHLRGKYTAFLDGDDEWLYAGKLREQIGFLEGHPDYAGSFHDAQFHYHLGDFDAETIERKNKGGYRTYSQIFNYPRDFYAWHSLDKTHVPHSSLVLRTGILQKAAASLPPGNLSLSWSLQLYSLKNSRLRYFNEEWSLYNDHRGGITKRFGDITFYEHNIRLYRHLLQDDYYRYFKTQIIRNLAREYQSILREPETLRLPRGPYLRLVAAFTRYSLHGLARELREMLRRKV